MLGSGLYGVVPDSSIDQFVYSGLVNGLVYNSAAGNVHVSKWHSSMEWESRSMALALEIPHDRALGMKGLAQMVYLGPWAWVGTGAGTVSRIVGVPRVP